MESDPVWRIARARESGSGRKGLCSEPGCGGEQGVAVSTDNGLTWTVKTVPGSVPGDTDPSVAIASDNTVYFGYQGAGGTPHVAVSTDHGTTWTDRGQQRFHRDYCLPRDGGRRWQAGSFGFLGTTTPGNYQDMNGFRGIWHFYIATTYDRGATWVLVNATGTDPVQIGSICIGGTTCGSQPEFARL